MFEAVVKGFQPLIELAQAASYPLGFLMFIAAGCTYMVGNELQAKKMAKATAIGYIMVQLAPALMKILHQATAGLGTVK